MQKHRDFSDLYSRYIENDLSAEERASLANYLDKNPAEKEKVERMKSLRNKLQNLRPIETAPDFDTILRARIQMSKKIGSRKWFSIPEYVIGPLLGVAAALLVFLVIPLFQADKADMQSSEFTAIQNTMANQSLESTASQPINLLLDEHTIRQEEVTANLMKELLSSNGSKSLQKIETKPDSLMTKDSESAKKIERPVQPVNMQF